MSIRKKILIVYPGMPHYRSGIINAMLKSDLFEYVFICDSGMFGSDIQPYRPLDNEKIFIDAPALKFGPFVFHKNLIKHIARNDYDAYIFHSSPFWVTIWVSAIIVKFRRRLSANWTHGIIKEHGFLGKLTYYCLYQLFDLFFLYGNTAKKNMISLGYSDDNLVVVGNSLNYEQQIKFRNSLNDSQIRDKRRSLFKYDLPIVIFIGRLTFQKKLHLLVDSINNLHKDGCFVNLLFVGDGVQRDSLEELVILYKINEYVNFFGPSYNEEEISSLIQCSDVCVSPGEVGLTAIHSMMYGTPVITHNNFKKQMPEYESIIPGVNGDFFSEDDIDDLAIKIKEWIYKKRNNKNLSSDCNHIIDQKFNPEFQMQIFENELCRRLNVNL